MNHMILLMDDQPQLAVHARAAEIPHLRSSGMTGGNGVFPVHVLVSDPATANRSMTFSLSYRTIRFRPFINSPPTPPIVCER